MRDAESINNIVNSVNSWKSPESAIYACFVDVKKPDGRNQTGLDGFSLQSSVSQIPISYAETNIPYCKASGMDLGLRQLESWSFHKLHMGSLTPSLHTLFCTEKACLGG